MKKIKMSADITSYAVESEPGDATRYEYIAIRKAHDWYFINLKRTFRYPSKPIDDYVAFEMADHWENGDKNMVLGWIVREAKSAGCNPYTYAECVRTIVELAYNRDVTGLFIEQSHA